MILAARTYFGGLRVGRLISDADIIGSNGHVKVIVHSKSIYTLRSIKIGGLTGAESFVTL